MEKALPLQVWCLALDGGDKGFASEECRVEKVEKVCEVRRRPYGGFL